jgi:outer membrane lipoprotein-sorting protein
VRFFGGWEPRFRGFSAVCLFLSFGHLSLSAQDQRALELMEEAGTRYRGVEAFCAVFDQEFNNPLLDVTTLSTGTLCQKHPNFFSMRFTDPAGDALVADGEHFWVFYPSVDSVQVLQFDMENRPGAMDFHSEFLDEPAEKYELTYRGEEAFAGRPTHMVHAQPREPGRFKEARIWLDAARFLILKVQVEEENGSVRTVALSEIDLAPPEDPDRFRFTPPPWAQVIRRQ